MQMIRAFLAGDKMGVMVVQTTSQASALLDWLAASPQKQQYRIWPLDALSVSSQSARQREAQVQLPAGMCCIKLRYCAQKDIYGLHESLTQLGLM